MILFNQNIKNTNDYVIYINTENIKDNNNNINNKYLNNCSNNFNIFLIRFFVYIIKFQIVINYV